MVRNIVLLALFLFIYSFGEVSGQVVCPHDDATLLKFSSGIFIFVNISLFVFGCVLTIFKVAAWNALNAKVVIAASQRVLLDKSPTNKLQSIEINGLFVIDNADIPHPFIDIFYFILFNFYIIINLDVNWIKVNRGGKFIAGSNNHESCMINNKVTVTFHGDRSLDMDMGYDPADRGNNTL